MAILRSMSDWDAPLGSELRSCLELDRLQSVENMRRPCMMDVHTYGNAEYICM